MGTLLLLKLLIVTFLLYHFTNEVLCKIPNSSEAEIKSKPWTQCCKMLYIKLLPSTAIYPFHSHAYELLLLTQSANWSEPPLRRAHWPPTPTLLTVADCQVGKSV